ncbi:hypothetical protein C8Q79DRAFT_458979 [Trametes meyenii]|nr:hypothetical protein C8Q79DRAFT_458979 [Trametes meyenii]
MGRRRPIKAMTCVRDLRLLVGMPIWRRPRSRLFLSVFDAEDDLQAWEGSRPSPTEGDPTKVAAVQGRVGRASEASAMLSDWAEEGGGALTSSPTPKRTFPRAQKVATAAAVFLSSALARAGERELGEDWARLKAAPTLSSLAAPSAARGLWSSATLEASSASPLCCPRRPGDRHRLLSLPALFLSLKTHSARTLVCRPSTPSLVSSSFSRPTTHGDHPHSRHENVLDLAIPFICVRSTPLAPSMALDIPTLIRRLSPPSASLLPLLSGSTPEPKIQA